MILKVILMVGNLPKKHLRKVLIFVKENQVELLNDKRIVKSFEISKDKM